MVLFWQKLDERFHNGEDFRYSVTDVRRGGHSVPLIPVRITEAFAEFHKVGLEEYTIFITSENTVGQVGKETVSSIFSKILSNFIHCTVNFLQAANVSRLIVPPASQLRSIQPKSFTRTLYPDNIFEVAWLPPKNNQLIVSYTIFWCKSKKDRPFFCEGFLDWEDIPVDPSSPKTIIHNITLPDDNNYQMAVAANTEKYSSGYL